MDKKSMNAGLDKVGKMISEAEKGNKKLSTSEVSEAKRILGAVASELFRMKAVAEKDRSDIDRKRTALKKSESEKLIAKADAEKEMTNIVTASTENKTRAQRIQESVEAVKKLSGDVSKLAASPELEILEKGHESSEAIKAPEKATKTAEKVDEQLMGDGKTVPELKTEEQGLKPQDSEPISQGKDETLKEGQPVEENKKGNATGDAISEPLTASRKVRAISFLKAAQKLVASADKEKDTVKKANMMKRVAMLERMADHLTSARVVKKAGIDTHADNKSATIPVYAANDKVLLVDGSIGTVKNVNGEKMTVSVAGVDKEVLAVTCKKVTVEATKKEEPKKVTSIAEKVAAAVAVVKTAKKVIAEPDPAMVSKPVDAPAIEPVAAPAGDGATVGTSSNKAVSYNKDLNKWTVVVNENEIKAFDNEAAANAFVTTAAKKMAEAEPAIIDSANPKAPESQEGIQKKLKGLDQQGKDYGTTDQSQKMDEQTGPIDHNKKKATTGNPGLPTDAASPKESSGSETIVNKIKGLTQQGKGYSATTADQKMDPKLGPLKEVKASANEVSVLKTANKQLVSQLAVAESKLLVGRAVKVGAIAEEKRDNQETVLAELYMSSPAEFKAYSRLVADLETNAEKNPTLANRNVRRVAAALKDKDSLVIDGTVGNGSGSLEDGTFFE